MNYDFNYVRDNNLLMFEYIRGSHLYGLNTEKSDIDEGGVYIEPIDAVLGMGSRWFPEFISDDKNDVTWNSLNKLFGLLSTGNPNQLESLWAEGDKVLFIHPAFELIKKERDKFITQSSIRSLIGYARTQLIKAKKLKSRILNPMEGEKLGPLDFIYTPYKQGSRKIQAWLDEYNLLQNHCGLTKIPHMDCSYNLYYDWQAHWMELISSGKEIVDWGTFMNWAKENLDNPSLKYFMKVSSEGEFKTKYTKPLKYHGIVGENSNEIRFSSILKDELPLAVVSYNKDEYSRYCQQWKEYHDRDKHHNIERFNLACKGHYDLKNACHCARLLNMGIEIIKGEGVHVDRTGIDRDFLLSIRKGELTYEEVMEYLEDKYKELTAIKPINLPEKVDIMFLNNLMIKVRKEFYCR